MSTGNQSKGSFWTSLSGILTGIAGIVAAGGTIAGLLLSHGSSSSTVSTSPTTAPASAPASAAQVAYPASVDQNYLSACDRTSNGNVTYCQCSLNWFQTNVTYTQLPAALLASDGRPQ